MEKTIKRKDGEKGAAAVELAVILPVLFTLLFGIVEFGRYFWWRHSVTAAATEAARMAILDPDLISDAQVTAWAAQVAQDGGVSAEPTVTVAPLDRPRSQPITVTVQIPFSPLILPQLVAGLVMPNTISASSTMVGEP